MMCHQNIFIFQNGQERQNSQKTHYFRVEHADGINNRPVIRQNSELRNNLSFYTFRFIDYLHFVGPNGTVS